MQHSHSGLIIRSDESQIKANPLCPQVTFCSHIMNYTDVFCHQRKNPYQLAFQLYPLLRNCWEDCPPVLHSIHSSPSLKYIFTFGHTKTICAWEHKSSHVLIKSHSVHSLYHLQLFSYLFIIYLSHKRTWKASKSPEHERIITFCTTGKIYLTWLIHSNIVISILS